MKIHYVRSLNPGRSYKLILQGLHNHPDIELCDLDKCDYIFYHHQAYLPGLEYNDYGKVVFIDFSDPPDITFPVKCNFYFKRSWPSFKNGIKFLPTRPNNHFPISYAIMDEFIFPQKDKNIEFGCYLRGNDRRKVNLLDFAKTLNNNVGEINKANRNTYDTEYFDTLYRTKITLSCNPMNWEGDSRTWETLASGSLLFVDEMITPLKHPLRPGEHFIIYDPNDLGDLRSKIKYYLKNTQEAEKISKCGHEHAMKHHRSINRIDDIIRMIYGSI